MLAARNLAAMRGERTLFRGLDFALAPGEVVEVAGANGSGKTTLLRTLCGLITPSEGEVSWRGENIQRVRDDYHRELAFIGHMNGVKDDLTPQENLRFAAALRGDDHAPTAVNQVLGELGLSKVQQRLPCKVLSQGQRRRVALARAFFGHATLWIFDEPFAALDVRAIDSVALRISEHVARGGAIVFSSHQDVVIAGANKRLLRLDQLMPVVTQ